MNDASLFPNGRYYRHSGVIPTASIPILLGILLPVSVILGAAYGVSSFWAGSLATKAAPIPFIGVIATLGQLFTLLVFVLLLGLASTSVMTALNIRSSALIVLASLVTAIIAHYVGWSVWLASFANHHGDGVSFTGAVSETMAPGVLWELIVVISERGVEIEIPLPNEVNWLFWAIELGIVIIGVPFMTHALASDRPFCETCCKWYEADSQEYYFDGTPDARSLRREFEVDEKEPLDVLTPIQRPPTELLRYYRAKLEFCPECDEGRTIDLYGIQPIQETTEKKKTITNKETEIVQNMWVTPAHFASIQTQPPLTNTQRDDRPNASTVDDSTKITLECNCGRVVLTDAANAGRSGRCPSCGDRMDVPISL